MSKRFKDLVPGNLIYILCLDPNTSEPLKIINGFVNSIGHNRTVLGVSFTDPYNKSQMLIDYFRVNPESIINDSLKEDKEHRMKALFETREKAMEEYIYYCEAKIQQFKDNINKISEI